MYPVVTDLEGARGASARTRGRVSEIRKDAHCSMGRKFRTGARPVR
jgi:hypothetical protein